jgi:hypothetical protein
MLFIAFCAFRYKNVFRSDRSAVSDDDAASDSTKWRPGWKCLNTTCSIRRHISDSNAVCAVRTHCQKTNEEVSRNKGRTPYLCTQQLEVSASSFK